MKDYSYFTCAPTLYLHPNFCFSINQDRILKEKFATINGIVAATKLEGILLRKENWIIYGCYWMGSKHRIMLEDIREYLGEKVEDSIGEYYNWKK